MGNLRRSLFMFGKAETSACLASAVDFGLTILLAELIGVWYAYSTFLGAVSGGIVNCCINYKWVFCSDGLNKRGVVCRYFVVWGGSILFNTLGTYLLTEWTQVNFIITKTIVACVVATLWNYQMQRVYVFRSGKKNVFYKNMNYRDFLQKVIYVIINPLIRAMIKAGITPNIITFVGFVGNLLATAFFVMASMALQSSDSACGMEWIGWGGLTILLAGLFDMMDGRLARMGNMSSTFGALWDSTLDRYSEMVSLFGISLVFLNGGWFWTGIVTYAAILGSVMVSYVRARAEGLGIECKVGLMQRPERVVVTALVAIISGCTGSLWWMAGGMTLIALLANLTAVWRLAHCRKELAKRDAK